MNDSKNNYGVIKEQGFAAGTGLGFNPVDKSQLGEDKEKNKPEDHNKQ